MLKYLNAKGYINADCVTVTCECVCVRDALCLWWDGVGWACDAYVIAMMCAAHTL